MICVSIAERTAEECVRALAGLELAEVRIDALDESGRSKGQIRRIFSQKAMLIATFRPGKADDAMRMEALICAIDAGAAYVDIEVESSDAFRKVVVEKARELGCRVIVSYHDYKRTPPPEELRQIVEWCFECGADIAKIACASGSQRDNARLLGLLDSDRSIIVTGMGDAGKITRIAAPLLGAPFTYASAETGKETAPGQLDTKTLKRLLEEAGEAVR